MVALLGGEEGVERTASVVSRVSFSTSICRFVTATYP
jgi:hypothetical protein